MSMTLGNDTSGCTVYQDSSPIVPLGCVANAAGAAHGGVARRGRHAQGDQAASESPRQVIRGHKLQQAGTVDWLEGSFTRPDMTAPALVQVAHWCLGWMPSGASELERGKLGYTHGWRVGGSGLLMYNPDRPDMGVHFSLPSASLALLDETPQQTIERVFAAGGHFTRVDVAIDTDQVTLDQVREACKAGELVTRSNEIDLGEKLRREDGEWAYAGSIIRIGSRTSRRYVRIYDKAAQQKVDGVWTRCEVEFKRDAADLAAKHILGGVDLASLVSSSIDFRDRSMDSNVSRCERLPWWSAWLGQVERVSFALRKTIIESVERAYEWVQKQVAPTLAFLDVFFRKEPTWVYRLCDANEWRIRPEMRALLAAEGG